MNLDAFSSTVPATSLSAMSRFSDVRLSVTRAGPISINSLVLVPGQRHNDSDKVSEYEECQLLTKLIMHTIFAGVICLIGLVGNSVSYAVLGRERDMFPVARFLLRSLAVTDNLFIVFWFIIFSLNGLLLYTGAVPHDRTIANSGWLYVEFISLPFLFMLQGAAIWLIVLIAATRCAIVCSPGKMAAYCTLFNIRLAVAAIAVLAFTCNLPRFFETEIIELLHTNTTMLSGDLSVSPHRMFRVSQTEFGRGQAYVKVFRESFYYIFSCFLPLLLLCIFNTLLIRAYRAFHQKRLALHSQSTVNTSSTSASVSDGRDGTLKPSTPKPHTHSPGGGGGAADNREDSNRVTLIMILVIVLFVVCNLPAKIVQLVWQNVRPSECMTFEYFLTEVSAVLELVSSSVNFVIYCTFLKRFCQHLSAHPCCPKLQKGSPSVEL